MSSLFILGMVMFGWAIFSFVLTVIGTRLKLWCLKDDHSMREECFKDNWLCMFFPPCTAVALITIIALAVQYVFDKSGVSNGMDKIFNTIVAWAIKEKQPKEQACLNAERQADIDLLRDAPELARELGLDKHKENVLSSRSIFQEEMDKFK